MFETLETTEFVLFGLGWLFTLVLVLVGLVNRQTIKDGSALQHVTAGVESVLSIFENVSDEEIEDIKVIASSADVKTLKEAIKTEIKQQEFADAGLQVNPAQVKDTGAMFKQAVKGKSEK